LAKSKTSTFVTELPLIVDSSHEKELLSRFQAARQLYNACLNEAMARMNLLRNCEAYRLAKQIDRSSKKARSDAFNASLLDKLLRS
jgi:putative transposase